MSRIVSRIAALLLVLTASLANASAAPEQALKEMARYEMAPVKAFLGKAQ